MKKKPFNCEDVLLPFSEQLLQYLISELLQSPLGVEPSEERLRAYLSGQPSDLDDNPGSVDRVGAEDGDVSDPEADSEHRLSLSHSLRTHTVMIKGLIFPAAIEEGAHDYRRILDKLNLIHFHECVFQGVELALESAACHFENCVFQDDWNITAAYNGEDWFSGLFDCCEFSGQVHLCGGQEFFPRPRGELYIFRDCTLSWLVANDVSLDGQLFENTTQAGQSLDLLELDNVRLARPIWLSGSCIATLRFVDCRFDETVALSMARIGKADILRTTFNKSVDFVSATIGTLLMEHCICDAEINIESAQLGAAATDIASSNHSAVSFSFTTFHGLLNLRGTILHAPLDLQNSNRSQSPNFFRCKISKAARQGTDRETFRMMRHSFEAIGNAVDSGRIYAMEMEAYRRELKQGGPWPERFLLWCNAWMSNHGQSYLRPIAFIFIGMVVFTLLRYGHQQQWLYLVYPPLNNTLALASKWLNSVAASLIIFRPLMIKGMEMLSLLFGLLFSVLVWQAAAAMRRHTRNK